MTTTPKRLADAAGRLAEAAGAVVGERQASLEFSGRFRDVAEIEEWRGLCAEADSLGCVVAVRDAFDNPVDMNRFDPADSDGSDFYFRVSKPVAEGVACFFTAEGFDRFLAAQAGFRGVCAVAGDVVPFATFSMKVVAWTDAPVTVETGEPLHCDEPRKFVRDLSGGLVPVSLAAWLPRALPEGTCAAFERWRRASATQLLMALPSEAWLKDGGEPWVAVKGPRTVRIPVGDLTAFPIEHYDILVRSAEWVYGSKTDAEIKHTLLANELARDWPEQSPWAGAVGARIENALSHAQDAYRLHVQGTSKDTIKALSDLRKALNDETDKVAAQTRDLIGGLWKDFAVAVVALGFRFTSFSGQSGAPAWANLVMIGTAAFLASSFCISVYTNHRIHAITAASREKWRVRLYAFLGEQDFEEMATKPLREVMDAYCSTRFWVGYVYAAVVVVLLIVGFAGLFDSKP